MSTNDPGEPEPQPEPQQAEPPAFELETPTFEVAEKADKPGQESRDGFGQ